MFILVVLYCLVRLFSLFGHHPVYSGFLFLNLVFLFRFDLGRSGFFIFQSLSPLDFWPPSGICEDDGFGVDCRSHYWKWRDG